MTTWLDQEPFIFTNWELAELTQFGYQANKETKDAHQAQLRFRQMLASSQQSTVSGPGVESRGMARVTGGDTPAWRKDH